jgi:glycosyltransferase involved in cell wall biosynthesis
MGKASNNRRKGATSPQPLRLLAVIEASSITGPAKNLLEFAGLAEAEGVETHIATFVRGQEENVFTREVESRGLPLYRIHESAAYDPAVIKQLRALTASLQPDVVQTHAVKSHFLSRLAGLPGRFPCVAFHHGYTWTSWKTRLYNRLDRWSLRAAQQVLTVSLPFRAELVGQGVAPDRIQVIHNAIRPDWGQAARTPQSATETRAAWKIPDDAKVVLIVGRLSREKDHGALVRAVASLPQRHQVLLLIVGDGPEREAIQALAHELKCEDRVRFTGLQPTAEPFYGIAISPCCPRERKVRRMHFWKRCRRACLRLPPVSAASRKSPLTARTRCSLKRGTSRASLARWKGCSLIPPSAPVSPPRHPRQSRRGIIPSSAPGV